MIGIRMLKICGKSITRPIQIIYKEWLEKDCFPGQWKNAIVVPVHKKMTFSLKLSTNISIDNLR